MDERRLYAAVRGCLLDGLLIRGISGVRVLQARQPQTHGAEKGPALYMAEVGSAAYGHMSLSERWDDETKILTQTQTQRYETTIQIMAWCLTDPSDGSGLTSGDLARAARDSLQSPQAVDYMRLQDVFLLRTRDIRLTPGVDDRGQWRANHSFDVTLVYHMTTILTIPSATAIDGQVKRV